MIHRTSGGFAKIVSGEDLESVPPEYARIERFYRAVQLFAFFSLFPGCFPLSFAAFELEDTSSWVLSLRIVVFALHGPVPLLGLFVRFWRRPWCYSVVVAILVAQVVGSAVALWGILVLSSPHPTADHGALNIVGYVLLVLVVVINALRCALTGRLLSLLMKPAGRALYGLDNGTGS